MRTTSRGLLVGALLLALAACSSAADTPSAEPSSSATAAPGMDESLREEALALVEERARALVEGDREGFLATVDAGSGDFADTQARWFDNLAELPVADLTLALGDEGVMSRVHGEGGLQLPVDLTMRLRGFDPRPVTRRMVYTFVRRGGEVVLADDRNIQIEAMTGWTPDPWDLTDIEVRSEDGVLAVFDEETVDEADAVMADLTAAAAAVRQHFPAWPGRFVAYTTSDTTSLDAMSSMTVEDTGAVAFPVQARPGGKVVSYRFVVNPDSLASDAGRPYLFRHELAHVAMGTRDDRSPAWLTEGIAEYVSMTLLTEDSRRAYYAEQLGTAPAATLEPGPHFYTEDPDRSYLLAGLVCDYLASTRGDDVLWDLVDTFRTRRNLLWSEVDDVVRAELGTSTEQLVADATAWASASS